MKMRLMIHHDWRRCKYIFLAYFNYKEKRYEWPCYIRSEDFHFRHFLKLARRAKAAFARSADRYP